MNTIKHSRRNFIRKSTLAAAGTGVEALRGDCASPALRDCIHGLARRTGELLRESRPFSARIRDTRLALEVAVIQRLAERLVVVLSRRDPLCARVHLGTAGVAGFGLLGVISAAIGRASGSRSSISATCRAEWLGFWSATPWTAMTASRRIATRWEVDRSLAVPSAPCREPL